MGRRVAIVARGGKRRKRLAVVAARTGMFVGSSAGPFSDAAADGLPIAAGSWAAAG